jgi:hypothetical protein
LRFVSSDKVLWKIPFATPLSNFLLANDNVVFAASASLVSTAFSTALIAVRTDDLNDALNKRFSRLFCYV